MTAQMLRRLISMMAVLVLMTSGIIIAAVQGSAAGVVFAVIVGTLVLSFSVRRDDRSRYVYRRRA
jgi:hypothetical protein